MSIFNDVPPRLPGRPGTMDQAVEISLVEVSSPDLWPGDHTHHTSRVRNILDWDKADVMILPPVSDDDELGR